MAEPVIKRRILTKVRRQFLHKRPAYNNDIGNYANLVAIPEQFNDNSARLLEPSLGLVETNRTISAGYQFLNSHYKVTSIRVDNQFASSAVTLNLQSNDVDILPWEYCAKRLESYGDLELAIWAKRLKTYHENYPKLMDSYFNLTKAADTQMSAAMAAGMEQAALACREIETKYAYSKQTLYGNKSSMCPVSLTLNDQMLRDIGHDVDSFVEWTNQHGIPGLFGRASAMTLDLCKQHMTGLDLQQLSLFQEGPEYTVDFYDKEGQRKPRKVKLYCSIDPMPEGFFVNVYVVQKQTLLNDTINEEQGSSFSNLDDDKPREDQEKKSRRKQVKDKEPKNFGSQQEDQVN